MDDPRSREPRLRTTFAPARFRSHYDRSPQRLANPAVSLRRWDVRGQKRSFKFKRTCGQFCPLEWVRTYQVASERALISVNTAALTASDISGPLADAIGLAQSRLIEENISKLLLKTCAFS